MVILASSWERPEDDARKVAWAPDAWQAIRPFSTGGTYVSFLPEGEGDARVRAAYGARYARLAAIKRRWDPENFFRINHNISPATTSEEAPP